jgi:subtilisin family serine protease
MRREGFLTVTLRPGEAPEHVPSHLEYLSRGALAVPRLGVGPVDRALRARGDGFRALAVHHPRAEVREPGSRRGWDDLEQELGLARSFRVRIADPERSDELVARLRELDVVESAAVQTLATAPFEVAAPPRPAEALRERAHGAHAFVRGPEALAREPGSERVAVACVDTGVALGHPELQRKLLSGWDAVDLGLGRVSREMRLVGDSRGRDFSPYDHTGHGSHVAGIIAAHGWQLPRGLGGRSLLLPIRVLAAALTAEGSGPVGVGGQPDIDAGIKVACDLGGDVLNLSFGTPATSVDPHAPPPHAAVAAYAARRGAVLVAAAGNSGRREAYYPAALPDVIAVGSVDGDGRRSRFSTYGAHLALAAPGERIVSVDRRGYRASSGTSFAAPFVAGAAALLVARARARGTRLAPAQVRELLTASARPLGGGGFDEETGHGLLDAAAAIDLLDARLGGAR